MVPLLLKKNTKNFEQSFEMRSVKVPHTYDRWHHHVELEFMHILKGSGTRYIGDSIEGFIDGDMILVGPHLAHFWRSDDMYYEPHNKLSTELILIHFLEDFAGKDFFVLPEMQHIKALLKTCKQGIEILGTTRNRISQLLIEMADKTATERLLSFINILSQIAISGEYRILAGIGFVEAYKSNGSERIDKVYDYIFSNFTKDISLETVAGIANMNVTAFCRYFKTITLKSFTNVLNDVRIGHACKLLLQDDNDVSSAGYNSGFNNISYFIKTFKRCQGITPLEFKKLHAK